VRRQRCLPTAAGDRPPFRAGRSDLSGTVTVPPQQEKYWMAIPRLVVLGVVVLAAASGIASAAPALTRAEGRTVVEAARYRLTLAREALEVAVEVRAEGGNWQPVTTNPGGISFGVMAGDDAATSNGLPVVWEEVPAGDAVALACRATLSPISGDALEVHLLCARDGVLVGCRYDAGSARPQAGSLWSPPRLMLSPAVWDAYAFWAGDGTYHAGPIAGLEPPPAYAGVSAWGSQGDTAGRLAAATPALVVQSTSAKSGFGVVFVDYGTAWAGSRSFLQRHTPGTLYLYTGYTPLAAGPLPLRWAWLAPFAVGDEAAARAQVQALLVATPALLASYTALRPRLAAGGEPLPDFPAALRRQAPVADIRDAVVYTVNESTRSAYGLDLASKVGSEVMIRAWFKWNQAPALDRLRELPAQAHARGALFGGGITCSALYDAENGITPSQLRDLATRGPDGELVDAWDQPGLRHGSLSSPAYLDYLFRWCREQVDAGADYLFMDEHTAALGAREGYDDYSVRDFRQFLLGEYALTRGWPGDDPRWRERYGIDPSDRALCPDGGLTSFDYRAYLRARDLLQQPQSAANPLAAAWGDFRRWRDDRAWKALTDRIRAYGDGQGRRILISANGIAPYVDLQVLGVWGKWRVGDGHIDLSENQLPYWRSLVVNGRQAVAGRPVPVVLFHDWGFGDPPFPWLAVPAAEREVWMRTRGAEIYAAGAFFAFPVLGPFGCDAGRDGTLRAMARQTAFYAAHRELYLRSRWLGCERLTTTAPSLSLSAWWNAERRALLVHVVNRDVRNGVLQPRSGPVEVRLPLGTAALGAVAISPDHEGEPPVGTRMADGATVLLLPGLEAYSLILVRYAQEPDLGALADPVRVWLAKHWVRPARAEFRVLPGGLVDGASGLEGFLQGRLHTHLRNPPVFQVHAVRDGEMRVHIGSVATAGARIEVRLDGGPVQAVDLPDLDGSNRDTGEYNRVLSFPIPAGRHRVSLDNTGGDWATVDWIEFAGEFGE